MNLCSAVVNSDGTRMEGVWMQTRNGVVIVSPNNSGTFEASLTERPPGDAGHVAWYDEHRELQRQRWAGHVEGGVLPEQGGPMAFAAGEGVLEPAEPFVDAEQAPNDPDSASELEDG